MANPDFPQNREEMLLNAISGSPYDVPVPVPQSRVEKWLAFLAENGIPKNVKIGEDVATVADLPAEGAVGEMHYVTGETRFYVWRGESGWTAISTYADVAEYAAYAEQIDSNQKLTVSTPFFFRPAGGGADVEGYLGSKAEISAIYGNTLVWNQLVKNGNFTDMTDWRIAVPDYFSVSEGVLTGEVPEGTASDSLILRQDIPLADGHKYFFSAQIKKPNEVALKITYNATSVIGNGIATLTDNNADFVNIERVFSPSLTGVSNTGLRIAGVSSTVFQAGEGYSIKNVCLIDITAMFGAGSEPSTVDEFRALFPLPYYAYDTGRLLNFCGTGIKTVGFNALAPDGTAKLLGGKAYEIVGTYTALSYSTGEEIVPVDGVFTPSSEGVLTVTGAGADTCVHLVWSGYRNGETAPYRTETKEIPVSTYFPDGMKSVGDVWDELRADKAVRRCGVRNVHGGDEDDDTVVTDGTNTVYALAEPLETPINPPLDMVFDSSDYGTEMSLPENGTEPTTTPMHATIDYVRNLRDKLQNLPDGTGMDGDYYVQIRGAKQTYKPLPTVPADDGVYSLKCTVTDGAHAFEWVADAETQNGGEPIA